MEEGYLEVCDVATLEAKHGRLQLQVGPEGRWLAILKHKGKLHCMDATCYHMGGPLLMSDIEDFQVRTYHGFNTLFS